MNPGYFPRVRKSRFCSQCEFFYKHRISFDLGHCQNPESILRNQILTTKDFCESFQYSTEWVNSVTEYIKAMPFINIFKILLKGFKK